ncbi:putative ribonuclease H-like domain-containing protein, partial [Tanacetum coccineum]
MFYLRSLKIEPKKISQDHEDESWVDAMQEELLQQEEGIDYDEVFAPIARIEAIMIFLAFASYMGFIVYQMDVKSAFLYGTTNEEVYVSQPPGFIDPKFPKKVYKVVKALYGLHQAPKAWYATLSAFLEKSGYRRGTIDKTLFIKRDKKDIMLVQVYVDDIIFGSTKKSWCDKFEALMKSRFQMSSMGELTFFLAEILKKFDFMSVQTASTPIETQKPLVKDEEAVDVDVHLYRSMIGSLMYLTASRPDIMFVVCACSRFQVTPKTSHLHAMKRIFRKSTTGGCQILGRRLISWQCKKQTIVATSTTEAEYVVAANCCGQVLWIQNQMLDYGFNFLNTKIYIDNESTICIVKNTVFYSKTNHIEIRHHFIRDAYEKKLIKVLKIHTDDNVVDLLTKAFDVSRLMKLEAMMEERRIFKCWFHHHTTNGHQFTMSNRHQELASPEQTTSGKDFLNPLMADSLPKTIWFSTHHALQLEAKEFQDYKVTKELKFIKEKIKDLDLSRLATTLNRLERSIQTRINKSQDQNLALIPLVNPSGSPRYQEATGGFISQTRSERVPTQPHDSSLPRVNTLGSDEG